VAVHLRNPFIKELNVGGIEMKKRTISIIALIVLCSAVFTVTACDQLVEELIAQIALDTLRTTWIDAPKILDDGQIHVIVSGSGSPLILEDRGHPCAAVVANGQFLVFDAGPGAVDKLAVQGYPIQYTEHVFLTHMHSDHLGGIASLINQSYVTGHRRNVIHVYGPDDSKDLTHSLWPPTSREYRVGHEVLTPGGLPDTRRIDELDSGDVVFGVPWSGGVYIPGVETMVNGINTENTPDAVIRTSNKQLPHNPDGYDQNMAVAHTIADMSTAALYPDYGWGELQEVVTFPDNGSGHGDLVVKAFLVDHYPAWPSYGYRIEYAGKVVVISGDTKSLMPHHPGPGEQSYWTTYAQDADILVHDAQNIEIINIMLAAVEADPELSKVPAVQHLLAQFRGAADHHTDVLDVARAAADANVAKLVLTHIPITALTSPQMALVKDFFLSGMHEIYSGQIIVGEDGVDITIPLP
jgi:ribonuclease BN (tRNA processing enzyme)